MTEIIRRANAGDAGTLAELHATSFAPPWDANALSGFLTQPACDALIVAAPEPAGFILVRTVADESEILTLTVDPARRGRGLASQLLAAALAQVARRGAKTCHLEVASDNEAALALYKKFRFERAGIRRAYYARGKNTADAITMMRVVDPP